MFGNALDIKSVVVPSTPTKRLSESSWKALFMEVLIHSHGLHHESNHSSDDLKEIWILDEEFSKELAKRYQVLRTPARKTKMGQTPRRSVIRAGLSKTMGGASLKRNLFKGPNTTEPIIGSLNI